CNLPFVGIGARSITASYAGDVSYAPAVTAPRTTTVDKGAPVLELQAPSIWRGLGTVPVSWSVTGPTDGGTVTILRGSTEVCSSSSLVGSCDVAIPAYDQSQNAGKLTLRYNGSPLWAAADTAKTGTIDACVPYIDPAPQPAESATVTVAPQATTCGSGESAGYYVSDRVIFSARAADGYHLTGFVGAPWGRYGITESYPAADITFGQNSTSAYIIASPKVFVVDGKLVPFTASPVSAAECVLVDVEVAGLPTRKAALNSVYWDTNGKCTEAPRAKNDTTWQVPVEVGSKIKMSYQTGFMPERTKFYGWEGRFEGGAFDRQVSYTVTASMRRITAVFGPICYSGAANLAQPGDGTMEMKLAAPNCTDPQTKERGWTFGSVGTISLKDASGDKLQTISRKYVSQGGSMRWVEESGWVAQKPVYFDKWNGDTDRITPVSTTTVADADGVRRTTRTVAFKVQDRPFTVGADYGRCSVLSSEGRGDPSEGSPGTVAMNTAANCPLGVGLDGERWYRMGTQVSLTAAPSGKKLKLLGWSGVPVTNKYDATVSFPLNDDVTAVASYGTKQNCRPLTVTTVPAGSLKLTTSFSLGKNACEGSYGSKFYDQGTSGNGILIDAEAATAEAAGAETVFAWSTNTPGTNETVSKIWQRTTQLNEEIYGSTTVVAYACEFVDIGAVVSSPDGRIVSGAGATNLVRGSGLDEFVTTQKANCATGSDPKSGYAGYAWTVGTQLTPLVVADPVAYRFTGWSGDVSGTGESPDAALRLVGPGRTASGGNYHYRVTANFQAICYTLSLPSDADKLEVVTAPNCPGMDPAKRMYLGGTSVVLHAADKGDTLFRNWVSGVDQVDADPHWAAVVMNADKRVIPYYSTKSVGEQITSYGTMVGEGMAIGAKKMVGVASAALSAYAKSLLSNVTLVATGIGYVAQGLEYLGVHGAGIDAMKNGAVMVDSMINMLFAPLDCITAWSAGGENTAVFAAQNFIGTAIVSALSSGAQQQPAAESSSSALAKLKDQAKAAKNAVQPGATKTLQAISAAKSIYEASSAGNIGIESSAYEAFASQASLDVFSGCMTGRAMKAMDGMLAMAG
ncbi:MAG: hypothetical protein J0H64_09745, partial [Actinobacteria bacterium]|nr:hypothetical protein [Actinomycetota bacterium]